MSKYPQLTGICKKAIENNMCNGCNKLENVNFTGQSTCEYVTDPFDKIKRILGVQEKLKI